MGGWCVIPKPCIDGVVAGVSVNVWNAKRRFLERELGPMSLDLHLILSYCSKKKREQETCHPESRLGKKTAQHPRGLLMHLDALR